MTGSARPACWSKSALRLEGAGAEGLIIGANSMHRLYDDVAASVNIPILHIAEYVGIAIKRAGHSSAALIGTRNVMTESFYRKRLVAHGIDLLPPRMEFVEMLDKIIYDELMVGKVTREAQRTLKTIITKTRRRKARRRSCWPAPNLIWWSMSMPTSCRCSTAPESTATRLPTGSLNRKKCTNHRFVPKLKRSGAACADKGCAILPRRLRAPAEFVITKVRQVPGLRVAPTGPWGRLTSPPQSPVSGPIKPGQ